MATIQVTAGGKERLESATSLLSAAFESDPVIAYMLSSMSRSERLAYMPKYFHALLSAAAMNGAVFDEANGWKSCGVLMPPGGRVDNPRTLIQAGFLQVLWNIGVRGCQLADACKAKGLAGEQKYYYVFFAGTRVDGRGRGLCSAIMRRYQEIAEREQLPIWLEATTESCMRLYLKLGWEIVDEMVLGKGKAGADGMQCKGGEGVKIWGMIWRPRRVE